MTRRALPIFATLALAGCGGTSTSTSSDASTTTSTTATTATTTAQGVLGPPVGPVIDHLRNPACGTELWAKKTLQDADSTRVDPQPVAVSSVADLNAIPDAGAQGASRVGAELHVYRFTGRLVEFKQEADSDFHVVMADKTEKTLVTEYPSPVCFANAAPAARADMSQARAAIQAACGAPSSQRFTQLSGQATVTSVGFYDRDHGQTGRDSLGDGNDVELHPVLSFSGSCTRSAS